MKRFEYLVVAGIVTLSLLAVAFGARSVWAQDGTGTPSPGTPSLRTVSVSGEGQASAQPDQAVIQLGVQTDADTATQALTANSQQMQSTVNAVRQAGVSDQDIQTQAVQLTPRYSTPGQQGGTPQLVGYTASNIVQVRVRDLSNLGQLLDAAVKAGANRVQGITFEVSDMTGVSAQAREAAWNDALAKAQQMAGLSGNSLGDVLSISESTQIPRPITLASADVAPQAAVPIQPGTQTVMATVQVTWALLAGTATPSATGTATSTVASPMATPPSAAATAAPTAALTSTVTTTAAAGGATATAPAATLPPATVAALASGAPTASLNATVTGAGNASAAGTPLPSAIATAVLTPEPTTATLGAAPTEAVTSTVAAMSAAGAGTATAPAPTLPPATVAALASGAPTASLNATQTAGGNANAAGTPIPNVVVTTAPTPEATTANLTAAPTEAVTSTVTTAANATPALEATAATTAAAPTPFMVTTASPPTITLSLPAIAAGAGATGTPAAPSAAPTAAASAAAGATAGPSSGQVGAGEIVIGQVQAVNANNGSLRLTPGQGASVITTGPNTQIVEANGAAATLASIRPGALIRADGRLAADGSFAADRVQVLPRATLITAISKIGQSDPNQHTLTLNPPVHGFSTVYGSLNAPITFANGSQATWQDLTPGATVEAIGISDAPGSMVAYRLRLLNK